MSALGVEPRAVELDARAATMDVGVELLDLSLATFPDSDAVMFSSDVSAAGALLACGAASTCRGGRRSPASATSSWRGTWCRH